jgi:hypothetical protein
VTVGAGQVSQRDGEETLAAMRDEDPIGIAARLDGARLALDS